VQSTGVNKTASLLSRCVDLSIRAGSGGQQPGAAGESGEAHVSNPRVDL